MSGYSVTRQSNLYDDGAYSVEIALKLDYAGPGALVAIDGREFQEFEDPREAADVAIDIAAEWRSRIGRKLEGGLPFRCFTIAGNSMVYATVEDAFTAPELRQWARQEYERLPKCDYCGGLGAVEYSAWDTGESFRACSEFHADELVYRDHEEVPG